MPSNATPESTSATLLQQLSTPKQQEVKSPTPALEFKFSFANSSLCRPDLRRRLQPIYKWSVAEAESKQIFSANELEKEFTFLNELSSLDDSQKLAVEEYKTALIRMVKNCLLPQEESLETPSTRSRLPWVKFTGLTFCIAVQTLASGFMNTSPGMSILFKLLPFAAPGITPLIIVVTCVISFLIGTVCLFSPFLKEWLGISPSTKSETLLQNYQEQLMLTNEVNAISSATLLKKGDIIHSQYCQEITRIAQTLNNNMLQLNLPMVTAFFVAVLALTYRFQVTSTVSVLDSAGEEHAALKPKLEKFKTIHSQETRKIFSGKLITKDSEKVNERKGNKKGREVAKASALQPANRNYKTPLWSNIPSDGYDREPLTKSQQRRNSI